MRPEVLFPLFADVRSLPGVGPRISELITAAVGPHVVDLCFHLPTALIDRRYRPHIADAVKGEIATLEVRSNAIFHRPTDACPTKYDALMNLDF